MNSILIRAEDKNEWERRAPLVPGDLKEILAKTNTTAFLQRSNRRFFAEEEYADAGATLCDDMNHADVVLGIKDIPEEKILDNKVYVFFSHTIKGQAPNMGMLQRIMDSGSTLIDYERVIDGQGRRLIYFGNFAGDAGALDILWLMGQYWQHHGIESALAQCRQALHYSSVAKAKAHLKEIGEKIKNEGLPEAITPLVIGVLGYGNVSQGAQQIFTCLPHERIEPGELKHLAEGGAGQRDRIYLTVFQEKDLVRHKQGQPFDLQDYYDNPEKYESQFEQYLPWVSILVNAVYWDSRYPRFVTWEGLKRLFERQEQPKLAGIADITCDVAGSIECNVKATNSGTPAYLCDPRTRQITDGYQGEGIVVLAVDNLPAELPQDASVFFSKQLKPFLPDIIKADLSANLTESGLTEEWQKAVIVYQGELTPDYQYLKQYLS